MELSYLVFTSTAIGDCGGDGFFALSLPSVLLKQTLTAALALPRILPVELS